jgi:hypothetical protein
MNIVEKAKHRAALLLPKLEAVRNSGNGATIHDSAKWLAIVRNYNDLLSRPCRVPHEILAEELLQGCDGAEAYLMEVAK